MMFKSVISWWRSLFNSQPVRPVAHTVPLPQEAMPQPPSTFASGCCGAGVEDVVYDEVNSTVETSPEPEVQEVQEPEVLASNDVAATPKPGPVKPRARRKKLDP